MGSGASRRKSKLDEEFRKPSRRKSREKDPEEPKEITNPAILRRRKVLFSTTDSPEFESVPPIEQYAEPRDDDDPVFKRFGRSDEANEFRRKAESIRYFEDAGYLREEAISLLDLDLEQGCFLSDRLFQIGQIQKVPSAAKRRPLLTCYELLALYSVFRHGTQGEFLELLFCIFDVDGDDSISVSDLTSAIDAFQAYIDIDIEKTHVSSKRLAEQAITEYSSLDVSEEKVELEQDQKSDDEWSKKSDDSDLSKKPLTGDTKPPKQRRCGFCRGKPPADDTSDDEEDVTVAKPQLKRRGLCRGKSPADSDDPPEPKIEKKKNTKSRCCLCSCGTGRKKKPALNFKQWQAWLNESGLLPEGFAQEYTPPPPPPSATLLQRPRSNSMQLGRARSNSIRGIDDDDMSD